LAVVRDLTVDGRAEVESLYCTGVALPDLAKLRSLATAPHFHASGPVANSRLSSLDRLLDDQITALHLSLTYADARLSAGFGSASAKLKGLLQVTWESSARARLSAEHEWMGRHLGVALPEGFVRQVAPSGAVVTSRLGRLQESIEVSFDRGAEFQPAQLILALLQRLDVPLQAQVEVSGPFETVEKLMGDKGADLPAWRLGYGNLITPTSDIDDDRVAEVVSWLNDVKAHDRMLRWSGFAWRHDPLQVLLQNAVVLRATRNEVWRIEANGQSPFPQSERKAFALCGRADAKKHQGRVN